MLLLDALSLTRLTAAVSPFLSLLGYLTICAGSIIAAWWIFSREQSPEGWEVGRSRVALVATIVALVLLSPVALANEDYEPIKRVGGSMSLTGSGVDIRIVPRGAPPPTSADPFSSGVLEAGRPNDVDVLLFLYNGPDAQEPYTHFSIRFSGGNLTISPGEVTLESPGTLPQASSRGPTHPPVPYLRVPATMTTPPPVELSKNPHYLSVNMSYQSASGEDITASSTMLIFAGVSRAPLEMAAVGVPFPLATAGAFAIRRWRMK